MSSRFDEASGGSPVQRTKKKNGLAKRATATVLSVAMLSGAGLAVAASAQAVVSAQSRVGIDVPAGPQGSGTTWLGSMWLNNAGGQESWCIQWDTTEAPITINPTAAEEANINYQITTYKNGSNLDQAAVAYNVHQTMDTAANLQTLGFFLNGSAQGDAIKARAAQIQAEANTNAGPYKVQPQLTVGSDGRSGTVTATELVAASGAKLTGKTATAVLSGPAKFSNGSNSITFNTGDSLAFTSTGNGTVSVLETVAGLPGTSVNVYTPPNSQAMITPGPTANASGKSADTPVRMDFQPVATSNAVQYLQAGDKPSDILHVTTSDGLSWLKDINGTAIPAVFDVDAYYSPTKSTAKGAVPAAATLFTTGKATATGIGDVTVTGLKNADKPGYYYYVAKFLKASQPDTLRTFFTADWSAGFNDANESSIQQYQPVFVTKASTITNGQVSDQITVTDNSPDTTLAITAKLILTDSKPATGGTATMPADAQVIGTVAASIKGNGTLTTPTVDVPWSLVLKEWQAGKTPYLTWIESAPATEATKAVTPVYLVPAETIDLVQPKVTTTASKSGTSPLTAHDNYVVTGTVPSGPGITNTITVPTFKSDNSTDGSAQPICSVPFYTYPGVNVTAAGPGKTIDHTFTFVGTYDNQEVLTTTLKGAKPVVLDTGKCGEQSERFIVYPTTAIVPKTVPPVPVVHTPAKPVVVQAQAAPMVPAGEVASETGANTGLIIGGSALALASMAIAGTMIARRRKNATEELADTK